MSLIVTVVSLLTLSLLAPTIIVSQSSQEQLETQKRLNEVESKRATQSATASTQKKTMEISFVEGVISSASNSIAIISTNSGVKTIYTNDSTKFLNFDSKGKKLIGFGDLKIGQTIMVVGLSKDGTFGTAKLVVRDDNQKTKSFSLQGRVFENKESSLTLKNFQRDSLPLTTITISSSTTLKKGGKSVAASSLKQNQSIVVTGTIDDKGILFASEILAI